MGSLITKTAEQDPFSQPVSHLQFSLILGAAEIWWVCVAERIAQPALEQTHSQRSSPERQPENFNENQKTPGCSVQLQSRPASPSPLRLRIPEQASSQRARKKIRLVFSDAFQGSHSPGSFRWEARHMLIAAGPRDPEKHRAWRQQVWAKRLWNSHLKKINKSLFPSAKAVWTQLHTRLVRNLNKLKGTVFQILENQKGRKGYSDHLLHVRWSDFTWLWIWLWISFDYDSTLTIRWEL